LFILDVASLAISSLTYLAVPVYDPYKMAKSYFNFWLLSVCIFKNFYNFDFYKIFTYLLIIFLIRLYNNLQKIVNYNLQSFIK